MAAFLKEEPISPRSGNGSKSCWTKWRSEPDDRSLVLSPPDPHRLRCGALLLAVKALFGISSPPVAVRRVGGAGAGPAAPRRWGRAVRPVQLAPGVESAKTALTGDYSLTRVLAPIPLPLGLGRPASPADLLYLLYLAGAAALLLRYALSYLRLRLALRQGAEADGPRSAGWRPHTAAGPAGPWRSPASPRPLSAGVPSRAGPPRRSARWTTR